MPSLLLNHRRIAILEDESTNRDRLSAMVRLSGGDPVSVHSPAPALEKLEAFFSREKISLVVSDHRLFEHGNYAAYNGAAAVATSYHSGRGGVLITAYENADTELSIREHRRWIPELIHAAKLDRHALEQALLQAEREVSQHQPTRQRVPYRTIMTVTNLVSKGGETVVKVLISQWNQHEEVGFPASIVPERMRPYVVPGNLLIAQVNFEAERGEDLFFEQFELPDPDALTKSKTIFGGA